MIVHRDSLLLAKGFKGRHDAIGHDSFIDGNDCDSWGTPEILVFRHGGQLLPQYVLCFKS